MQIKVANNNLKILENYGSILNYEKGVGLDFLKQNPIFMISYIPQDDSNFFHRMLENFTINFIIFIIISIQSR